MQPYTRQSRSTNTALRGALDLHGAPAEDRALWLRCTPHAALLIDVYCRWAQDLAGVDVIPSLPASLAGPDKDQLLAELSAYTEPAAPGNPAGAPGSGEAGAAWP